MRGLDGSEQVVGGIVDPRDDIGVSLSVGGPEDNDVVESVVSLEASDILSNVVEVSLLVVSRDQVIGSIGLIRSDKVGVRPLSADTGSFSMGRLTVDTRHGSDGLHHGSKLPLQVVLQYLGSSHGLVHRHTRDIPPTDNKIVGVNHRQHLRDGYKDILASLRVGT